MHDWLYEEEPPLTDAQIREFANANLPASGGLNLLLAAVAALICANTRRASSYRIFIESAFGIGPPGNLFSMNVAAWFLDWPILSLTKFFSSR